MSPYDPALVCCVCNRDIADIELAVAVIHEETGDIEFFHKGNCDCFRHESWDDAKNLLAALCNRYLAKYMKRPFEFDSTFGSLERPR